MSSKPQLVVALDLPAYAPALRLARKLKGLVPWLKVGLELFGATGPRMVTALKDMDFKVFLDLKFHDIPNTVQRAVLATSRLGADMLTLHLSGGERMALAALEAVGSADHKPLLFGVTLLTSTAPGELFASRAQSAEALANLAKKMAIQAHRLGLDGVVCSGRDLGRIKRATGLCCLTPGIRLAPQADDQRRVVSPAQAVRQGADYLVVGRPISAAPDPVQAAHEILQAMNHAALATGGQQQGRRS